MSTKKRIDWVDRDYHLEENKRRAVTEGDGRAGVLHKASGRHPPPRGREGTGAKQVQAVGTAKAEIMWQERAPCVLATDRG